jgi:zinc transport system substrate-binding protein
VRARRCPRRFVAPAALATLAAFFALSLVAACRPKAAAGKAKVVVSTFPVYDLVRRVAGPDADVVLLVPGSVEQVASARLGVMVGLGLDPWMENALKEGAPAAHVLKVGDRVPTLATSGAPDAGYEKGTVDPHVWLDPQRAAVMTKAIAEELARVDAGHAAAYRSRAENLGDALHALDQEVEAETRAFKARVFVTPHGSFTYFAARYHLQITEAATAAGVVAVFTEPQLDPLPAKNIADAAHVPLGVLDPVGGGPETDSYETLIRFDAAALAQVTQGR